jgi:hypothetical protein
MIKVSRNIAIAITVFSLGVIPAVVAIAQETGSTAASGNNAEQASAAEIAKKLQNPVANLISVPLQSNFDFEGGPDADGYRYTLNVQPIIPFILNDDWNLITRTIVPVMHQENFVDREEQSGLGDITQTFFLSPAVPGAMIWGVGPVFLYPTAGDELLGQDQFGAGPSVVVLKQSNGWSLWTLANHIWKVAGEDDRDKISMTYINPGISYQTKTLTTFLVQAEPVYDWTHEQWTVPVNVGVSQLIKIGNMPVSIGLQGRYYAEKPEGGPDWGLRFVITPVFTK